MQHHEQEGFTVLEFIIAILIAVVIGTMLATGISIAKSQQMQACKAHLEIIDSHRVQWEKSEASANPNADLCRTLEAGIDSYNNSYCGKKVGSLPSIECP